MGLPPGHEPGGHLQLWPDPRDLPDRRPGLLHPSHQLRGEEFRAAHHVLAQRGEEEVLGASRVLFILESEMFKMLKFSSLSALSRLSLTSLSALFIRPIDGA